jgi:hypothetical protein
VKLKHPFWCFVVPHRWIDRPEVVVEVKDRGWWLFGVSCARCNQPGVRLPSGKVEER